MNTPSQTLGIDVENRHFNTELLSQLYNEVIIIFNVNTEVS